MSIAKLLYSLNILAGFPVLLYIYRSALCARADIQRQRSKIEAVKYYGIGVLTCILATIFGVLIP